MRPRFTGEIEQVPPAYSALKVEGKRAYALARAGAEVELESRKVRVYALSVRAEPVEALPCNNEEKFGASASKVPRHSQKLPGNCGSRKRPGA